MYVQHYVAYRAIQGGANYSSSDWAMFAGDRQLTDSTYVSYGPKPMLESGELPKGRTAAGWLVWEVPRTGKLTLASVSAG